MEKQEIKLTSLSHGAGCGCKVAPAVLDEILKNSGETLLSDKLLVGNDTKDDAAVYDLGNGTALISTVDFFTPIVNNPFDYGRIAAANALSDVYAMGGKPFMAIAVLGFPVEKLGVDVAREIIRGGKEVCKQAGVSLAGGHTIDAPEPFFGLSVNGLVNVEHLKKNSTAKDGDVLFMTKPIGSGVITTALKRGQLKEEELQQAVDYMTMLNTFGAVAAELPYVHAMTDVTGFGLLGHLIEMCEGSGLSAEINYNAVPLMDKVKELTGNFIYADNTMRNWKAYESKTAGITSESLLTLCDPQTSGGLLIAVGKDHVEEFKTCAGGVLLYEIGKVVSLKEKRVYLI